MRQIASTLILMGLATGAAAAEVTATVEIPHPDVAACHRPYVAAWLEFCCGDDVEAWRASGLLDRLDPGFSRDAGAPAYVQDRILAAADALREWIDAGAAILVSGSRDGTASAVQRAFRTVLGNDTFAQL